jgi:hypothetical protein
LNAIFDRNHYQFSLLTLDLAAILMMAFIWQGRGVSFQRPQDTFFHSLSNAPVALNTCSEQAEKASVATGSLLWGCPITNFKATLPFNRMKQFFAAFKKRPCGPALAKPKGHHENYLVLTV